MIIDVIKPTFSIGDAKNYFQISIDGGLTWSEDGTSIELNYYALNKMKDFISRTNPLHLLFRKKQIEDSSDYVITKILVNEASKFEFGENYLEQFNNIKINDEIAGDIITKNKMEENGKNAIEIGIQNAEEPAKFGGKYIKYDDETKNGGLNFNDFKIASINNTDMQIVFFVDIGENGSKRVKISLQNFEWWNGSYYIKLGLIVKNINNCYITKNKKTITFTTQFDQEAMECNLNQWDDGNGNIIIDSERWYQDGYWNHPDHLTFEYGITKETYFTITQLNPNPTTTGEIEWELILSDEIWNGDPEITIGFTRVRAQDNVITIKYPY